MNRIEQKLAAQMNKPEQSYDLNPMDEIFKGDILNKAEEFEEQENKPVEKIENSKKIKNKSGIKIKKKSIASKKNNKKIISR